MALDAAHRSSIYQKLVPILGSDDANALMTEFPGTEQDELVTKGFLRAELAQLRLEVHTEISDLRDELHSEISGLRDELHTEVGGLRAEMIDGFRRQTVWMSSILLVGIGVATGLARAFAG